MIAQGPNVRYSLQGNLTSLIILSILGKKSHRSLKIAQKENPLKREQS